MNPKDPNQVETWMRLVDNDIQVLALAVKQLANGAAEAAAQTAQRVLDRDRPT